MGDARSARTRNPMLQWSIGAGLVSTVIFGHSLRGVARGGAVGSGLTGASCAGERGRKREEGEEEPRGPPRPVLSDLRRGLLRVKGERVPGAVTSP